MDPNNPAASDELNTKQEPPIKQQSVASLPPSKSQRQWMALGDLVDDQLHPFVIHLDKTTIDPNIEKLYGPFEDTPLWAYPPLASSPKSSHLANNAQQVTNSKEDLTSEITRLKALIAERQRNNIKQRLDPKTSPQQQPSPAKEPTCIPSPPVLSSTTKAPRISNANVDLAITTKASEPNAKTQSKSSLRTLQQSQANNIHSPHRSSAEATPTTALLTLTPTSDVNNVKEILQTSVATEQDVIMGLASQESEEDSRDGHDHLLDPSSERSQQMESMEAIQANVSTVGDASDNKASNDPVKSDDQSAAKRLHDAVHNNQVEPESGPPILENDIDTTDNSNSNSNSNKSGAKHARILPDIDSDMDDKEDFELLMLKSEEEKHKTHLTAIRRLQAETLEQLDGMDFEKRKFESYIRKMSAPMLQQQRQPHLTTNLPARQREATLVKPVISSPATHEMKLINAITDQLSSPQKRQRSSDNRSTSRQRQKLDLTSTMERPYANTAASSSILDPTSSNESSSSNIRPTKKSLYRKTTVDTRKTEIQPLIGGMDVTDYFKEFSDLVRNRAIVDSELERLSTATDNNSSARSHRKNPRIEKLITLNDITFSCAPFRLTGGMKKQLRDFEQTRPLRYFESLLLAMMVDGIPRIPSISPIWQSLSDILHQAPYDFKNSLLHYKNGQLLPGLDLMLDANLAAIRKHGNLEILWATYTELMVYRHGYSDELASSMLKAQQYHPFSLDIYWQTVFAAPLYPSRCALITEILKSLSTSRSSPNFSGDSTTVSEKSADILLRTLIYNGIRGILDQLSPTTNVNLSDSGRLLNVSLNSTPSYIYIADHDLCYLWMSIIVYYVYGQLQQEPDRYWYYRASESGLLAPNVNALFLIDWTTIQPHLLNDEEQTVVVSVLLEMLSYFCQKARSNGAKKSLLVAVWRNLVGCLEILPCYGPPGTLMLLKRNMQATWKIKALQPEMAEMTFELEKKIKNHQQTDIDPLCNKVLKSTGAPMSQLPAELFLAYRSALSLEPKSGDSDWKLLTVAWRLGRPLWLIYNFTTLSKLDNMKAIVTEDSTEPPRDLAFVQINYLCGLYSSALGVADSFEMLQVSKFKINAFRKIPLAWINALMVHLLHFWLTRDSFLVQSFLEEVSSLDLRNNMIDKDGRFLFMRFKKDCDKLIKN